MPGIWKRKTVYRSANVKVEFELDPVGLAACAVGPELAKSCYDVVNDEYKPFAISISPRSNLVWDYDPVTKTRTRHRHYRDNFKVERIMTGLVPEAIGKPPMLRVGARLVNSVRHAAAVEFGNKRYPNGHHILRKVLEHIDAKNSGTALKRRGKPGTIYRAPGGRFSR